MNIDCLLQEHVSEKRGPINDKRSEALECEMYSTCASKRCAKGWKTTVETLGLAKSIRNDSRKGKKEERRLLWIETIRLLDDAMPYSAKGTRKPHGP